MARLRIVPIVEGDGEVECVPVLLRRIWKEIVGGEYVDVLRPILKPRSQLVQRESLQRIVEQATIFLGTRNNPNLPGLVLILLDADHDFPAELGPQVSDWARDVDRRFRVACVAANREYETWFVAAARSLVESGHLRLKAGESIPSDPEGQRLQKGWIEDRYVVRQPMQGTRNYKPTVDQLPMTQAMNLTDCRSRSASFDKLCRELEARLALVGPSL